MHVGCDVACAFNFYYFFVGFMIAHVDYGTDEVDRRGVVARFDVEQVPKFDLMLRTICRKSVDFLARLDGIVKVVFKFLCW